MLPRIPSHPLQSRRFSRQRGMTLLEILAAVVIISLLAALLFPAFARMQRSSRAAACQTNLRNIGAGLGTYSADNGRTVPAYRNSDRKTWGEILAVWSPDFASDGTDVFSSVYRCPENRTQARGVGAGSGERQTSYAINGYSSEPSSTENRYTDQPIGKITAPSQLYAVTEGIYHRSEPNKESGANTIPDNIYPGQGLDNARYPHDGAMNVLFADGHVERLPGPLTGRGPVVRPGNGTFAATFSNGIRWYAN